MAQTTQFLPKTKTSSRALKMAWGSSGSLFSAQFQGVSCSVCTINSKKSSCGNHCPLGRCQGHTTDWITKLGQIIPKSTVLLSAVTYVTVTVLSLLSCSKFRASLRNHRQWPWHYIMCISLQAVTRYMHRIHQTSKANENNQLPKIKFKL